jgi:hypothetical protein
MNKKQIIAIIGFMTIGLSIPLWVIPKHDWISVLSIYALIGGIFTILVFICMFIDWLGTK